MRMLILVIAAILYAMPSYGYVQDESLAALEGLVRYSSSSEQMRIEAFLTAQHVIKPSMYARLICQEIPTSSMRKLFAVKLVKESRGQTKAVSSKGAVGPWQVMRFWVRKFNVKRPTDPRENLRLALKVYGIHLADAKGQVWNHKGAVWRYSGGSDLYVAEARKLYKEV